MAVAPSEGTTAGLGCSPGSGPTVRVAAPEVADPAHSERGIPRVRHRRGVFFPSSFSVLSTTLSGLHFLASVRIHWSVLGSVWSRRVPPQGRATQYLTSQSSSGGARAKEQRALTTQCSRERGNCSVERSRPGGRERGAREQPLGGKREEAEGQLPRHAQAPT